MISRGIAIHALIFAFALAVAGVASGNQEKFSDVIAREVRKGDGTKVDLGRLVDVPWDRVFVFAPYTSLKSAQKVLPGSGATSGST